MFHRSMAKTALNFGLFVLNSNHIDERSPAIRDFQFATCGDLWGLVETAGKQSETVSTRFMRSSSKCKVDGCLDQTVWLKKLVCFTSAKRMKLECLCCIITCDSPVLLVKSESVRWNEKVRNRPTTGRL